MSAAPAAAKRIDTSHIKSPRDPMTPEEREAIRQELRESSEAIWRIEMEHGSVRDEIYEMFGNPFDVSVEGHDASDAA